MNEPSARKRGAPPKVTGGLSQVLYIRATDDLIAGIDALVEKERLLHPGHAISRSDVIRDILWRVLVPAHVN